MKASSGIRGKSRYSTYESSTKLRNQHYSSGASSDARSDCGSETSLSDGSHGKKLRCSWMKKRLTTMRESVPKNIDTGFHWYDKTNIDSAEIKPLLYD